MGDSLLARIFRGRILVDPMVGGNQLKPAIAGTLGLLLVAAAFAPARAETAADTVLVHGKIVTLDGKSSIREAVAIRDGWILATGSTAEIQKLASPKTRVIDLQGKTVIPGLIDSHMHAIRAALSFATEVNWIDAHTIQEALTRLKAAAAAKPKGSWLIVAGGWTEQQFRENRRPTQAEIVSAAPDNPVYIQHFYDAALLNPAGFKALGIDADADVPPHGILAKDASGAITGWIEGDNPTITALFNRLPTPSMEEQVEGTKKFFRELNRLAMTGVVDPGGFNIAPSSYQALFKVWQDRSLTLRVRYSLFAQRAGHELEDYKTILPLLPNGFGDDMLRFNGIGELVTVGIYNNDKPSDAVKEEFYQVAKWAAEQRYTLTIHWPNDVSAGQLLDIFARIDREVGMKNLRWSLAHLNDASDVTLQRMKALNVGWTMQDAMYFSGESFLKARGAEQLKRTPPIVTATRIGVHVGAGTDAHRVMSYNPFVALQWMLDGKTVAGMPTRAKAEIPSRLTALRLYTEGSAWFSFEESERGSLAPGKRADLAVLDKDYLAMPVAEIGRLQSLMTMVGGKVVYAAGPFRRTEEK